jgi:hypothetical protein
MFTIILLLYMQQNLDVTLESSNLRGRYRTKTECEAAAVKLRGPLPTPRGYDAAWHDALCLPINRDVRVNDVKPIDLGKLLQQQPPTGCAGEGAWRRIAELCRPAPRG